MREIAAALIMLGLLGCGSGEQARVAANDTPAVQQPPPTPSPVPVTEIDLPPPRTAELEQALAGSETDEVEGAPEPPEPTAAAEPEDPLAPILPSGPEPGSPEADAELAALLEESTLTQEEFDKAFRNGAGPNVRDDQLVFGGGRKQPVVKLGAPKLLEGSLDTGKLLALAQTDERKLIGCHAMALANDPNAKGSVTLRISSDASGAVTKVEHSGGVGLGDALIACLASAAKGWRVPEASKATVELPLTLSTQ
jgi:hypothetical protein